MSTTDTTTDLLNRFADAIARHDMWDAVLAVGWLKRAEATMGDGERIVTTRDIDTVWGASKTIETRTIGFYIGAEPDDSVTDEHMVFYWLDPEDAVMLLEGRDVSQDGWLLADLAATA